MSRRQATKSCKEALSLLTLELDGELDMPRRRALQAHLGSCPPCRALLDEERARSRRLREALAPPPESLRRIREETLAATAGWGGGTLAPGRAAAAARGRLRLAAAAAMVLAALALASAFLGGPPGVPGRDGGAGTAASPRGRFPGGAGAPPSREAEGSPASGPDAVDAVLVLERGLRQDRLLRLPGSVGIALQEAVSRTLLLEAPEPGLGGAPPGESGPGGLEARPPLGVELERVTRRIVPFDGSSPWY